MKQVVAAIIQRPQDGKYLLVNSKRDYGIYTGCFYPPGGKMEIGEDEEMALKRELKQELGLDFIPLKRITESPGDVKDQITYWWRCVLAPGQKLSDMKIENKPDSTGVSEVRFLSREEMKQIPLWPATELFFQNFTDENFYINKEKRF